MKKISIFGSTGSIGTTAIKFIQDQLDLWKIFALVANNNVDLLIKQAKLLNPEYAVIADEKHYKKLKDGLSGTGIKVAAGLEALLEVAKENCDIVLMAITGIAALKPVVEVIKSGSNIALANKEALICGGELVLDLVKKYNVNLIPVDSEHNAIFQILQNESFANLDKIYLTASGGPFRKYSLEAMENVKLQDALKHPNWQMGKKITIDSASMVNKALELIEAHYLFSLEEDKIDIIIHPESIIHGMVSFIDGAIIAELGVADMTTAISYAICWPNRILTKVSKLDFVKLGSLNFESLDDKKFPAPRIARECIRSNNKEVDCIIFNTANEVAVENFINEKIKFLDISKIIELTLNKHSANIPKNIEDVYLIDQYARSLTNDIINNL